MSNTCVIDLFEQPPIRLLLKHMEDVEQCVKLLPVFIQDAVNGDWQSAQNTFNKVVDIEHRADQKKFALRDLLRKDLILQVQKRDLLNLVIEQDKMANTTRDVCGLLLWRRDQFPHSLDGILSEYSKSVFNTCSYAKACLEVLVTSIDSVFTKESIAQLDEKLKKLEMAESETDTLQYDIRQKLLLEEQNFKGVQMVCFYDVISKIGSIADRAESYGQLLFVCVSD